MDGPGELKQGTFDYRFNFKNVDLDVDSYCGIALDVRFDTVDVGRMRGFCRIQSLAPT